MGLFDTLGMGEVEADPNALPDGRYPGVVFKSELVHNTKKNELAHAITYQVTHGERKGGQRSEWTTLGKNPQFDEDGNLVSFEPTITDTAKRWYKKRFVDLGFVEHEDPEQDEVRKAMENVGTLVGIPVTFGVKKKDGYINVTFVEVRNETEAEQSGDTNIATGLL